jgi:ATP phosphoribosyltransferase
MSMAASLKLTLPKGRIQDKVLALLAQIGLRFHFDARSYRPTCSDPGIEAKMLKPQNIPALVALGRHDCGFTGHDWLVEQEADVVELLDLGLDPVRIVAAMPEGTTHLLAAQPADRPLIIASEYRKLAADFIAQKSLQAVFIQTYGATEALPPEDADLIIDNSATGSTLRASRLVEVAELLRSTTRFIACPRALDDPERRRRLEEMCMLMRASLQASQRVLLEMNVPRDLLEAVVRILPCMRSPTVSPLYREEGFAVKVAVPAADVPRLIPLLYGAGARDILEYKVEKIVT